jgi:type IV pilus assembly protein PilM
LPKVGVGLDIGTSAVKIVELQTQGKDQIAVSQYGMVELPDGSLGSGIVKDFDGVAAAIKEAFRAAKINARRVVVAIAGQTVIVRQMRIPLMSDAEAATAIKWEAERYIPFPSDEVTLDFSIIKRDLNLGEMEVMLVCAHNDIIHSHLETLKQVGVAPQAMDIQPFALMRTLGMEAAPNSESIALLDIGAGTSDLIIVKESVPRFTRIIPLAGAKFTQIISKMLSLDFPAAERAKIEFNDALFDFERAERETVSYQINFAIAEGLKELVMELRRSFDYYQLQNRNEEISRLIISGGGSKITNLATYLSGQLNIPVEKSILPAGFHCPERIRAAFEADFPKYAVAYGLALREVIPA